MPYARNTDLPDPVRDNMPAHAQEIYRRTFNSAWEDYQSRETRWSRRATRESTAHKTAWAAVKKVYRKHGDRWVRRERVSAPTESR